MQTPDIAARRNRTILPFGAKWEIPFRGGDVRSKYQIWSSHLYPTCKFHAGHKMLIASVDRVEPTFRP
jgi:hypothetical protein